MANPHYPILDEEGLPTSQINFRALGQVLIDKIWVIIFCLAAAGFLTYLAIRNSEPVYAARVVLQVEQDKPNIINIQNVQAEDFSSVDFVKTVEQSLQSRVLFERILETHQLAENRRFNPPRESGSPSKASLISRLAGMTEVKMRPGTRLIDVTVEHRHPEIAQLVANSLVEMYIQGSLELQSNAAQEANELLRAEAARLGEKLKASERALHAYKEKTQFVPTTTEQNFLIQQLQQRLTDARGERIRRETELNQFERSRTNLPVLLALPTVAQNPTLAQLRSGIVAQQAHLATIEKRYKSLHPVYVEAQSRLEQWENAFQNALVQLGDTLKTTYENALAEEREIQSAIDKEEDAAIQLSKASLEYNRLAREYDSDRTLYETFLNRIKETSLAKDLGTRKVRVIDTAELPESPVKPNKQIMMIIGLALGGMFGLGLALLLGMMDSSFKSMDEAEEYLRMPALSTVPRLRNGQLDSTQLVMGNNTALSGAESFRSLRTSLSIFGPKGDQRIFLFTSALPEEGKTFCSLNYAFSLAQQGLKVLLIDCDLRRPSVEQCLCSSIGQLQGLSDYLNGNQIFHDIVYDTGIPLFHFIPAGTIVPNPSELLAQEKFNELIREALQHFDRVVLDSAPIFGVSDTLLMINRIHVACLVVRACKTPRKKVSRAVQILQSAGAPLAGMVLNQLPPNNRRNANDPYYDYGYSYGRNHNGIALLKE